MRVDGIGHRTSQTALDVRGRGELPRVVIIERGFREALDELLLRVAKGDPRALADLEGRIGGLVRLNIRRVLGDARRTEAITRSFFAEVLRDAIEFNPDQQSAEAWLLTRAHRRAVDGIDQRTQGGAA